MGEIKQLVRLTVELDKFFAGEKAQAFHKVRYGSQNFPTPRPNLFRVAGDSQFDLLVLSDFTTCSQGQIQALARIVPRQKQSRQLIFLDSAILSEERGGANIIR